MAKKLLIVVGTRPNFIKITQFDTIIRNHKDQLEMVLVHTGQHYDYNMSEVFFQQLQLRKPDYFLDTKPGTQIHQISQIMASFELVLNQEKPNYVMVVGDVNSTFAAAFVAHRLKYQVLHLESGLRSFDMDMPEEINRLLTDQVTDHYFVTEESGWSNLLKEGKDENNMHFVGNTMIDTLVSFQNQIEASDIVQKLNLIAKKFALVTIHRPSNVDSDVDLLHTLNILKRISKSIHLVFPMHPRTSHKIKELGKWEDFTSHAITLCPPLDYFGFQKLICDAKMVITDSGGVQEETTYRQIPCLTLRKNTERPITVSMGSNELLEFDENSIMQKVQSILENKFKQGKIPPLWDGNATQRIVDVLLKL